MNKLPMRNFPKFATAVVLLMIVSTGFPPSVQANQRATKEQIAKRAQESESLWNAPGSNYAAISSIFIQPGTMPREDVLKRLTPALDQAACAQDKAALHYLIGEAHYWGGLAELRQTRNQAVLLGLGDKAVTAYLAAWMSATNTGVGAPATEQLRQTIASRLNQVLSTEVCGATLSTNLQHQIVACYIDGSEADGQPATALPASRRPKVYRNLGIQSRLADKIPATMPTNFLAVCEALDLAIDVGATNAALRFAANLQTAHAAVLTGQVSRLRQVYTLYRDSRDPRAEECVKVLAAVDPYGCLDLYDYSVRRDARYSIEQRRTCLDEYFKGLEAKQAKRADAYWVALERLLANGDFALVVEVADVALDHRAMVIPSMDRALIWRSKAIAHEKRGEPEKADEAYRKGLGDITYMGRSELESMFQRSGQTGAKQTGAKQAGQGGANK